MTTKQAADKNQGNRAHIRVACSEDTHFVAHNQIYEGTILNRSIGGTYLHTNARLRVGQNIVVAGPFARGAKDTKKQGRIVRCDENGIAVKFR